MRRLVLVIGSLAVYWLGIIGCIVGYSLYCPFYMLVVFCVMAIVGSYISGKVDEHYSQTEKDNDHE